MVKYMTLLVAIVVLFVIDFFVIGDGVVVAILVVADFIIFSCGR